MKYFNGKTVMVTGAGGSIGGELCRRVFASKAKRLVLVSLTESGLYRTEKLLRGMGGSVELSSYLGSVQDYDLMREVCEGVDIVVHAAAHKHIPICESNPLAAVANNVGGTKTLINAASDSRVGQFVLISSDKAVHPSSVMGATKRAAELLINHCRPIRTETRFFAVRFGNVLDSDGSVLPLWREQIARGGPVTLTDERCERYFMSIAEACDLVLGAITLRPDGGLFVLDMGKPRKLVDVARELINGCEVEIKCIGLRPGEKLTEELFYGGDLELTAIPKVMRVVEPLRSSEVGWKLRDLLNCAQTRNKELCLKLLWEAVS